MSSRSERLHRGLTIADRHGRLIVYRYLAATDNLDKLTALLHESYAPRAAAAGMRFVASYQDVDVTRQQIARGETTLAVDDRSVVGTVTLVGVDDTRGSPFYDRPDVASFGQFAVRPSHQRCGIGLTLMALAERRARKSGAGMLGLDTAEQAAHLIAMYEARGYRFIEYVQWPQPNYRSVVFGKSLR